jgi:hypothetical protein
MDDLPTCRRSYLCTIFLIADDHPIPVDDLHLDDLLDLLQLLLGEELLHHQALLPLAVPLTENSSSKLKIRT